MSEQLVTVKDVIINRRSIKQFNGKLVEGEDLLAIIDDATWAPNHGNREPWRIVAAYGQEQGKLHDLLRDVAVPKWKELSEEALALQMKKFTTPGAYAFVIIPEDVRQKERLEDFAAASCFLQNIQLLAWEKGIGSCWKTPPFIDVPKFREALGVKSGERVIGMLQLGYFDEAPKGKERKKASDIVTVFGE